MSINVFVVDDEFESSLKAQLNRISGFTFFGVDTFDCDQILSGIKNNMSVLLLDILDADGKTSGIRIFNELERNEEWNKKSGSVQIVFFSINATAKRHYEISKDRRVDISGYLDKKVLLERNEDAINVLRTADKNAKRYKTYPSLADPILKECEILYSSNSHAMHQVREKILLASKCYEPVLIQGETGTGKELVAKAIWKFMQQGPERIKGCDGDKHLAYNIGSAPTYGNLQYTELFGAYAGSATGIAKYRTGLFERAHKAGTNGGTVFLDEIGDADAIIQVALLRVLQENEIIPLGGFAEADPAKKVNFRLTAASNVNLPEKVREGTFRKDLYYRLNTIQIVVPPLRERKDDIPVLVYHFLEKANNDYGKSKFIDEKSAKKLFSALRAYDWPGNVRQLESFVRRSYVMSPGDELLLWDDMQAMTIETTTNQASITPAAILENLAKHPLKLSEISRMYGKPITLEVLELYKSRYRKLPDDTASLKLFSSEADAVRKYYNGLKKSKQEGKI